MQDEQSGGGQRQVFSLSEITESIARMFGRYYTAPYWIRAEISKLNYYPASGHCFPDLVEKQDGKVKSQVRSIIWRDDLFRISQKFEEVTREQLRDGIAIMFQAYVTFTSEYGLSLHIVDIEPLYTMGEMAREKLATIGRLKKEGTFLLNKTKELPLLIKRVAVISALTSKGYNDLLVTLGNNPYGYRFISRLYPALLQGEGAVDSIRRQLQQIRNESRSFDAVLIIRGGGDEVGLACYDHYNLASEVASFPLPVITGIGHSTNETVVEMVAAINKITPTDVAHFMISGFRNFEDRIEDALQRIGTSSKQLINARMDAFADLVQEFQLSGRAYADDHQRELEAIALEIRQSVTASVFNHRIAMNKYETAITTFPVLRIKSSGNQLDERLKMLHLHVAHLVRWHTDQVETMQRQVQLLDPEGVLKRGFTITRFKGRSVGPDFSPVAGTEIETETLTGKFKSIIAEIPEK